MDCRRAQEDDSSTGCLPLPLPLPLQLPYSSSSSSNPTPPPNPPPHQNPIRVSAFSKPSTLPSPRLADHSNRNGSTTTTIDFTTNPMPPSPPAASAPPPETPPAAAVVKYRECLRNHAASIGGHVLDGCCEFMPCDSDPLRCAACDCHRSFHRKSHQGQGQGQGQVSQHTIGTSTSSSAYYHHRRDLISVPLLLQPPYPTSAHPFQTNYYHHQSQSRSQSQKHQFASSASFPPSPSGVIPGGANSAAAAFGGLGGNNSGSGATTESSSEERLDVSTMPSTTATEHLGQQQQMMMMMMVSKKRFRTKFSPEQKEKMMGFAERVGWRMQRRDDATVEQFCREVGIRRQVLKVWMHNNKHSIKKHQEQQQPQPPNLGMS